MSESCQNSKKGDLSYTFCLDIFEDIRTGYFFFRYFDGGLISAEIKSVKPEEAIYRSLMEKYSLVPEECLFIDDSEINVKAAENLKMKGLATFGSLEIPKMIDDLLKDSKV